MHSISETYRRYVIKVNGGSGVLVQPATKEYSYILTAKHNLTIDDKYTGDLILSKNYQKDIKISDNAGNSVDTHIAEIYPHANCELDIAIIKICYTEELELKIGGCKVDDNVYIFGYPNRLKDETVKDDRIQCKISNEQSNVYIVNPVNPSTTFDLDAQETYAGISGGGVFKEKDNSEVFLIGIENNLSDIYGSGDKLRFTSIESFKEIITENKLAPIYPPFMNCFSNLKDSIFDLPADHFDSYHLTNTKQFLLNTASKICNNIVKPIDMLNLLQSKLLIDESDIEDLHNKQLWINMLEILTSASIASLEINSMHSINNFLKNNFLKFKNTDRDWSELLCDGLRNSDFQDINKNANIFIATPKRPHVNSYSSKKLINIGIPETNGLRIDQGIVDPYEDFQFYHTNYLKKDCVVEKASELKNLRTEADIRNKLKEIYIEVFNGQQ